MTRQLYLIAFFFIFSAPLASAELAIADAEHAAKTSKVSVTMPYAFATAEGQKNGAVFLKLQNDTSQNVKVVDAATDVAKTIELHTHAMDGGIMMMRKVENYDVPAGSSIALKPMGHHVMLIGLKAPLAEGETFPLTLGLDNGQTLETTVTIVAPGTTPKGDKHRH